MFIYCSVRLIVSASVVQLNQLAEQRAAAEQLLLQPNIRAEMDIFSLMILRMDVRISFCSMRWICWMNVNALDESTVFRYC
jgi:hypothetical protein